MAKIAIVGAGRVGSAAAKILLTLTDHEIVLIDSSEESLATAHEHCITLPRAAHKVALYPEVPVDLYKAEGYDELESTLFSVMPDLVLCTTPFIVNIDVAKICKDLCHYVDFTEDNDVTAAIAALDIQNHTYVPQTGLAPGLINYIGLSLFETLDEPKSLELRVGALPQVSFGPAHYAVTWSVEGLINAYMKPTHRKVNGLGEELDSLEEHETMLVNGVTYEAFTTSGGVGMLQAYDHIPSVQYKTLRYPGHLAWVKKSLSHLSYDDAVAFAKANFVQSRDDVVALAAQAVDVKNCSASAGIHFYPCEDLNISALELTTAGIGIAIVELILAGELPKGVLTAVDIPFDKLMATASARFVFEYMN